MKQLIIVGAGGFGLEIAAYAEDMARAGTASFTLKGFLDDSRTIGEYHADYPLLGGTDEAIDPEALYILAIGQPEHRLALSRKMVDRGAVFTRIIHPLCYIASSAKIGAGSIIAPFAFVGPQAVLGRHCVLNVHSCAGHETRMGDGSVLSPHSGLHGRSVTGLGVFLGSNAYVTSGIEIGDHARLAAGAIAYSMIPPKATALGNPAAFRRHEA